MRSRFLRLVVIPLLAALAASIGAYRYLASMEAKRRPANLKDVVVMARAVPPRTTLGVDMLATRQMPPEFVDPSMVTSIEDAVGKTTTVPLAAGEIIYRTKLAGKDEKTALAFHVPAGKRAVSVPVNEVSGVAGFIQAGDRVDLILTVPKDIGLRERSRLVLEDVPVLAVAQSMEVREEPARDLKGYTTLTLAVSPEQAVLVAFGEEFGSFLVALRSPGDTAAKGEIEYSTEMFK